VSAGVGDSELGAAVVSLGGDDDEVDDDREPVGAELWSSPLHAAVRTRIRAHRAAAVRVMVGAFRGRPPIATSRDHEGGKSLWRAGSAGSERLPRLRAVTDRGPVPDELTSERDRPAPRVQTRATWVRRGLAGAVLVAVGAVVGPNLLSGGDEPRPPRPEPTTSQLPTSQPTPSEQPLSALNWTVRGDLAGDAGFMTAALAVAQVRDPTMEKVMYAATLPDGSRIAFVGAGDHEATGLAFRGANVQALHVPAGAAPSAGRLSYAGQISVPDALAGWAGRTRSGEVVAVLLGRPVPLDARLSVAIDYSADGRADRSWQPVHGREGSAILSLGRKTDPVVVARTNADRDVDPLLMDIDGGLSVGGRRQAVAAKVRVGGLDGSYRGPEGRALRLGVVDGVWALLDPRDAQIRVVWSGRLGGNRRGALLVVRRADGPTLQLFLLQQGAGRVYPQGVRHVPWAHADLLPWITQTGEPSTPLLLVNPRGAGTAVLEPPGRARRRVPIGADGLANLGDDQAVASTQLSGSTVTVLSTSGRTVASIDWPNAGDFDPLALASP
jgi:hypothetical protein